MNLNLSCNIFELYQTEENDKTKARDSRINPPTQLLQLDYGIPTGVRLVHALSD